MTTISISVPADGGNIDVLGASSPEAIRLALRNDGKADFKQWFYYRVTGAKDVALSMTIENAGAATYTDGWPDYRAVASTDLEHWYRVDTTYRDGQLIINDMPAAQTVYYAYFAPYPIERYRRFAAQIALDPAATALPLGTTLDGEPLDLFRFGTPGKSKPIIWVIGRQHPGETMGSWWMEGFLARLTNPGDAAATALQRTACLYVVPLVNIDGARRGHLRTNAAGTDLNRAWAEPSAAASPEVLAIRNRMDQTGCSLFLDVHGDEAIANNFIAGAEGISKWSAAHQQRLDHFKNALLRLSPAFQTVEGYDVDAPGTANLALATNQIAERFDCLAMTLEMPFKDAKVLPDAQVGWSPGRCRDLGASCLDAIWQTIPLLK